MKRLLLVFAFTCLGMIGHAQSEDDVLMVVAGKMIPSSEFQSSFQRQCPEQKVNKESVNAYLKQFVNCRLQVAEAEALKLDTLTQFRVQMANLTMPSSNGSTEFNQQTPTRNGLCVEVAHLFLPLGQHATYSEQQQLKNRMDSAYNAVQQGADMVTMIHQMTPGSQALQWIGMNQTLADVEYAVFHLDEGEVSSPILSTDGFHLLKCIQKGTNVVAETTSPIKEESTDYSLQNDYRSGLLMYYLYDREMKDKARNDVEGQKSYFQDNQKSYAWSVPHYKGVIYQCKDKKTQKQVKKLLSKQPMNKWAALSENPSYSSIFEKVRMSEPHLYVLGENPMMDELAFGGPKATTDAEYPYYGISGKEQKKYPDSYEDVQNAVISDYQHQLEQDWLESLHKRYEVAVNEKALKKIYKE